jgi:hypothetical protein
MQPCREGSYGRSAGIGGVALVIGLVMAEPSGAVEFPSRAGLPAPVLPECTCRFHGRDVPLGTRVCLATPQGAHYARCVRELNVTSWRPDEETCVVARAAAPAAL